MIFYLCLSWRKKNVVLVHVHVVQVVEADFQRPLLVDGGS